MFVSRRASWRRSGCFVALLGILSIPTAVAADGHSDDGRFVADLLSPTESWRQDEPQHLFDPSIHIETGDINTEKFPTGFRLPRPFAYSRSYTNGRWRVDGVGVSPAPDVEIRASGGIGKATDRVQGDVSLRFQF